MEGVGMLLFLCITMLIGSFVAGLVPLALSLSENKMRHITILGAGLLIGTALAVIIPEGIIALYSEPSGHSMSHHNSHIHKRSLDDQPAWESLLSLQPESSDVQDALRDKYLSKRSLDDLSDEEKIQLFAFQRGETINGNRVLSKRSFDQLSDDDKIRMFGVQRGETANSNRVLSKRDTRLYSDEEATRLFLLQQAHNNNINDVIDSSARNVSKRDLSSADAWAIRMFLNQRAHNNNVNQVAAKRRSVSKRQDSDSDALARSTFLRQLYESNNVNEVIDSSVINGAPRLRRDAGLSDDQARRLFLLQKDHNNNQIEVYEPTVSNRRLHHVTKRETFEDMLANQMFMTRLAPNNYQRFKRETDEDRRANRLFLLQAAHNNNQVEVNKKRRTLRWDSNTQMDDATAHQLFLAQRAHNNNQIEVDDASVSNRLDPHHVTKRESETDDQSATLMFLRQRAHNNNVNQVLDSSSRVKRNVINPNPSSQEVKKANEPAKNEPAQHIDEHEAHGEHESKFSSSHSAIGITLVLGFVFMLIIDQIGGNISHRHNSSSDPQAIRSKVSFVTTLGLVVHAAADGIALGAAAATSKTDVEMIVFAAIMLHKAPAAFGLVSFLIHEGLDRTRVRRHLTIFALAAPAMAILTFLILSARSDMNAIDSSSTGLCMLFSAGTFLYVSTVHVLPEVQSHNEDRQFRPSEMLSFIIGAILPLFLSMGHSH